MDIHVGGLANPRFETVDVHDDASVALRRLTSERTPCVVVCREGAPVGMITLRDLAAVCAVHWPDLSDLGLRAEQIMSSPLIEVQPDTTLMEIAPVLHRSEHECLVVVEQGRLVGVLQREKLFRVCLRLLTR